MKKGIILCVALILLYSNMASFMVYAKDDSFASMITAGFVSESQNQKDVNGNSSASTDGGGYTWDVLNNEPEINITYPEKGYAYLFNLRPIRVPIFLRSALVVSSSLRVEAEIKGDKVVHHVKFVAKQRFTGEERIRWDYRTSDGISCSFDLLTGRYTVTVVAYDEYDNEVASSSIKVFFIKMGRDDFGVWIHTRYNGGETHSVSLNIGLLEFMSMLNTGVAKKYRVTMQSYRDTTINLRFAKTSILNNTESVVETDFSVDTACDTSKDYEVYLEIKFPFGLLNGEQTGDSKPYFDVRVGYNCSSPEQVYGPNAVNTTFFFGRSSIVDPRVFRMHVRPNNLESGSRLTLFSSYSAIDEVGDEVFYRMFSVDFEPATELTITSVLREGKIRYDFGDSAGVRTRITFRAAGGILDDIKQSFTVDPLPSYMSFDLTLLGQKSFKYESDMEYSVTYSLDSLQNGNIVTFEIHSLPRYINATWGLDLSDSLSPSSFVDINMSSDVEWIALYLCGVDNPFMRIEGFPKKLRVESSVDIPHGSGNITFFREMDDSRVVNVSIIFDDLIMTNTFELKNSFMQYAWSIDVSMGNGYVAVSRDSDSIMSLSTSIDFDGWMVSGAAELKNSFVKLSWDVDSMERSGSIRLERSSDGGDPTFSAAISHDGWRFMDTFELKNTYLEVFWNLPHNGDNHVELCLNTDGGQFFENMFSMFDDDVEICHLILGVSTDDHLRVSWDYNNGHITNFEWDGRILRVTNLDIMLNLQGDVFTITGNWDFGESGSFNIEFNKDVTITFVDFENEIFRILGHVSFYADRQLGISWHWGDMGYFTVTTYDEPLGENFYLEILYDRDNQGEYRYGMMIAADEFLNTYFNISWYRDQAHSRPYWWIASGGLPSNWDIWLLWNYEWWEIL